VARIFNFGCSFTSYIWPTWADLLLHKNQGYNLGISGTGNVSILYRVMEADRIFNFTQDDQIIVMFSSPVRWDRIYGTPLQFSREGQIINASNELKKFNNKLYTFEGLSIQSFYSILAVKNYLENKKIKFLFGSITDIFSHLDNYIDIYKIETTLEFENLKQYIKKEVPFELLDMFSFIKQQDGVSASKNWKITKKWADYSYDYHPRPLTYYNYLEKEILPKIPFELKVSLETINIFEKLIDNSRNHFQCFQDFKKNNSGIFINKINSNVYINNE